jgi:hypothetical protein
MVSIWLCPKYWYIRVQNYSCASKIIKFDLSCLELCVECSNLWRMYTLTLLKLFGFFMIGLWTQNILPLQFLQFLNKIIYYYNYYIIILQFKVELYIENKWIIYLSMINGLLHNWWVEIYFYAIFSNLIWSTCNSIWNYFW